MKKIFLAASLLFIMATASAQDDMYPKRQTQQPRQLQQPQKPGMSNPEARENLDLEAYEGINMGGIQLATGISLQATGSLLAAGSSVFAKEQSTQRAFLLIGAVMAIGGIGMSISGANKIAISGDKLRFYFNR